MLSPKKYLSILKRTNALLEGHFVLSSGLHSSKYIQCAKLLSFPHIANKICQSLSKKIKKNFKKIDLILAPAMGGIVIGYEIGRLLKKETIFCERIKDKFTLRRGFYIKKKSKVKQYNTTLWISLPDIPGKLGEVTTLIGENKLNISSVEMKEKTKDYINFRFNLIINDLKNFTNFISELKQKELKFKIIRHEDKKYAFTKKIFKYFKKN